MQLQAATAADTEEWGRRLAAARPAAAPALTVLYLSGELGSGKTTFARGFLHGAAVSETVRSPTYTLLEPYATHELILLHIDLYRLQRPGEIESLGLREYARPAHLWLIEWPERGAGHLPAPDLSCAFTAAAHSHAIVFEGWPDCLF